MTLISAVGRATNDPYSYPTLTIQSKTTDLFLQSSIDLENLRGVALKPEN